MGVQERSWVCHYIVPCPGNSSCEHCKPGEPHPHQHAFSKRVTEPAVASAVKTMHTDTESTMPTSLANERYLKRRKLIGSIFGNLALIPFDPELDPEPFNCYNCWSDEHLRRDCPEPPLHVYCRNCGRREVEVQDCPRCAEGYREFVDKWKGDYQERRRLSAALYKSRQFYREEDLCPLVSAAEEDGASDDGCGGFEVRNASQSPSSLREEFATPMSLRSDKRLDLDECWTDSDDDGVYQSVRGSFTGENECYETVASFVMSAEAPTQSEKLVLESEFRSESTREAFFRDGDSVQSNEYEQRISDECLSSLGDDDDNPARDAQLNELFVHIRNQKSQDELAAEPKAPAKRKSLYCCDEMDDEVNYDDVIVDENERSESLSSADYAIQEFLDLLDALKHLPIEVQNVAVLHFVSQRRKQFQERMQERMLLLREEDLL